MLNRNIFVQYTEKLKLCEAFPNASPGMNGNLYHVLFLFLTLKDKDIKMCTGICRYGVPIIQNQQYKTATNPVKNR